MIRSLDIQIKKRTMPEWLTLFVVFMPFFLSLLIDFIGLPSLVKYSIDVAWVLLLGFLFVRKQVQLNKKQLVFVLFTIGWLLYVGIVYVFHFQSPFYFLWGLRNNLRFYIAFIACSLFLKEEDAEGILNIFDYVFWFNIPVTFFQFFVMGYQQDHLGGIFGVEKGCNAYTSILFVIVITKSILWCLEGVESNVKCLLKCGFALIIAAMAEMKVFFVFFVIILLIAMLLSKFSWKKMLILLSTVVMIMFAGNILTVVFGEEERLTLSRVFELVTANNYATTEDLGRFTAIPTISENIFEDWSDRLFGYGLGNCDTSAFSICNTPFYQTHEYLHYSWFSSAFLFLETGYIGLGINLIFFVICFIQTIVLLKQKKGNMLFNKIAVIVAILSVVYTFYNSSLRKECGFIMYFVLALPFIYMEKKGGNK